MDDLKIAIAGVGTVGNGVLILLKKTEKKLKRKLVEKLKLLPLLLENQEILKV